MSKKKKQESDLYYLEQQREQEKKETIEQMMKRKKDKERKQRIEEKKKQEFISNQFDSEMEKVIQMTNKNNQKQEQERRKKISKQEKKRFKKIKKIKTILKLIVLIGLISGSITFALTSPIFNIKDIKVEENNKIPSETIISLSTLQIEENIFKFYNKTIENNIKENPYVEKVSIHRKLPNTVEIKVTERVAQYAVDYMGQYAYINTQGYILEIAQTNNNMPIIQGATTKEDEFKPGKRLCDEDLNRLEDTIQIMSVMKESGLNEEVTSIDISNKNEYIIYLADEKKKIHIGDTSNLSNKILYVQAIIEQEKNTEGDIFVNGDINNGFNPYFRDKV